jgi:DNA-binding response OmpR family regulator
MLPRMSGYDVVRRLREEDNWVPVMMLSAKDGPHDQADGLDYGADDYLTKPFSYVVLLARVRALLRRRGEARPVVLTAGDVALDPATREVTLGGDRVSLTPREHAVLEYLMRHRGQVLSKRALIDGVWDDDFDGDPNIVEVYVGYLRRKLDTPFGTRAIKTVRGAGYQLLPDE